MRPHRILSQLAAERRTSGRSQIAVARDLFVSDATLSFWETGRHQPKLEDLDRLAAMFGYRLELVPVEDAAEVAA